MSKTAKISMGVQSKIDELKNEELKLFHSYNRHAASTVKLEILNKLIAVINKIEILNIVNR